MADLKPVYKAPTIDAIKDALNMLAAKWENLSTFFKYPGTVRRVIYTTNNIEAIPQINATLKRSADQY